MNLINKKKNVNVSIYFAMQNLCGCIHAWKIVRYLFIWMSTENFRSTNSIETWIEKMLIRFEFRNVPIKMANFIYILLCTIINLCTDCTSTPSNSNALASFEHLRDMMIDTFQVFRADKLTVLVVRIIDLLFLSDIIFRILTHKYIWRRVKMKKNKVHITKQIKFHIIVNVFGWRDFAQSVWKMWISVDLMLFVTHFYLSIFVYWMKKGREEKKNCKMVLQLGKFICKLDVIKN